MPPAGARRPERAALDAFAGSIETRDRSRRRGQPQSRTRAAAPHEPRRVRERDPRSARARRGLRRRCCPPTTRATASTTSPTCSACRRRCSSATSSAAAKISRLAVGERDAAPAQVTYTVKGDLSQNQTLDGQPLGTRGGTTVTHNFPVDGEYLIRLSLLKLSFGQVFGEGAEGEELEVTLNGQRVKLFKLDEVPMFFMRESPGSHPAKPQPTDPLEERVKMTPDIRLEFTAEGEGRAADDRRRVPQQGARRERGPRAPAGVEHLRRLHRHAVRLHHRAAPLARRHHRAVQPDRPRRHAEPPAGVRLPPGVAGRRRRRARGRSSPTLARRAYRRAPTDADVEPLLALLSGRARTRPATSRPASRWRCAASWPIRSSSSASSRRRPASRRRRRIASATPSSPRGCRSSCGRRFPTTSC